MHVLTTNTNYNYCITLVLKTDKVIFILVKIYCKCISIIETLSYVDKVS